MMMMMMMMMMMFWGRCVFSFDDIDAGPLLLSLFSWWELEPQILWQSRRCSFYHIFDARDGDEEENQSCHQMMLPFTPFLDDKMVCSQLNSIHHLSLWWWPQRCHALMPTRWLDDVRRNQWWQSDAKADGPNHDGKMMPCPVAHMMLAKMKMPTRWLMPQMQLSKLMSDALMVMLLSMTMAYLMLLTKLTRCTLMTDADAQSYFTLMEMLPSLLTAVVIDEAARWLFHCCWSLWWLMLTLGTFDEIDVGWMEGSDEPLSLTLYLAVSKKLDGWWDGQEVGAADAAVVEQMVFGEPLWWCQLIDERWRRTLERTWCPRIVADVGHVLHDVLQLLVRMRWPRKSH